MANWLREFRFAARLLWKNRGVSAVAFVTLAFAIGANTAIFTVINALLIRPLPFPEDERLVGLLRGDNWAVSEPKFNRWARLGSSAFSGVAAYDPLGSGFNLVSTGPPDRVVGSRVSSAFFGVLGVRPAIGRDFRPDEDVPGGPRLAVLSHGLWHRRFAARPEIVGRTVTLNGEPYTVLGVMPPGFSFPDKAELWTLFQFAPSSDSRANYFAVVARLAHGLSLPQARAAMTVVADQIRRDAPGLMGDRETITVQPLRERLYGDMRPALLILFSAVAVVLLIACVNVANLQMAQVVRRQGEIALRRALGAQPWTIVRGLLAESVLLAGLGGATGVLLAYAIVPAALAINPVPIAGSERITVDPIVLGFSLAVSILAGVAFGLLPAWQVSRSNVEEALREGGQRSTGTRASARLRRLLVAGEVALALMLTIAAALLVKSLAGLRHTDPGFGVENVLTVKLSLPEARYGRGDVFARFGEAVEQRIGALPAVRSAAFALSLPLELGPELPFTIEGQYGAGTERGVGNAQYRSVGPSYFEALRIPLRQGRRFDARDRRDAVPVALVNETAARRYWPGARAIGQRITVGRPYVPELADAFPREIVGVVADVREEGLGKEAPPILYVPAAQQNDALTALCVRLLPASLVVRADGGTAALLASVQQAIWSVDPEQPVSDARTMEDIVTRSLGPQRFNTVLLGGLASLALLLAAVGLYGVLSHLVGQQTREIGVRMALGASEQAVMGLFLREGMLLVFTGIAAGTAGAVALTRFLQSLLTGISATDPWVFAAAALVMITIALVATLRPALRAARVDPVRALRTG